MERSVFLPTSPWVPPFSRIRLIHSNGFVQESTIPQVLILGMAGLYLFIG